MECYRPRGFRMRSMAGGPKRFIAAVFVEYMVLSPPLRLLVGTMMILPPETFGLLV